MIKIKTVTRKALFAGFCIAIFLCVNTFTSSVVKAAFQPGCYNQSKSTTCPSSDTIDTSGKVFDTTKYCYSHLEGPTTNGALWQNVQCSDLSTPVSVQDDNPGANCTNLSQAGSAGNGSCGPSSQCESTDSHGNVVPCSQSSASSFVVNYLNPLINFLGIGVGLIIIIMVVIGGIQYSTSGGNQNQVAAAKKRIGNALLALVAFALMYAVLQWIIPGGLFR